MLTHCGQYRRCTVRVPFQFGHIGTHCLNHGFSLLFHLVGNGGSGFVLLAVDRKLDGGIQLIVLHGSHIAQIQFHRTHVHNGQARQQQAQYQQNDKAGNDASLLEDQVHHDCDRCQANHNQDDHQSCCIAVRFLVLSRLGRLGRIRGGCGCCGVRIIYGRLFRFHDLHQPQIDGRTLAHLNLLTAGQFAGQEGQLLITGNRCFPGDIGQLHILIIVFGQQNDLHFFIHTVFLL